MTVYVSDIIGDDALGLLLIDTAEVRNYTLEARYAAFLLAQRSLASLQPKATATHAAQRLVAGAKQSIPTGGLQLIDVVWNSGTDGTTIGRAITLIDRGELALIDPDWAKAPADSAVERLELAFLTVQQEARGGCPSGDAGGDRALEGLGGLPCGLQRSLAQAIERH